MANDMIWMLRFQAKDKSSRKWKSWKWKFLDLWKRMMVSFSSSSMNVGAKMIKEVITTAPQMIFLEIIGGCALYSELRSDQGIVVTYIRRCMLKRISNKPILKEKWKHSIKVKKDWPLTVTLLVVNPKKLTVKTTWNCKRKREMQVIIMRVILKARRSKKWVPIVK